MKVTIQQKALNGLASQAASVADPKGPMVILGMVVLRAEGDRLRAEATDLYSAVRTSAPCTIEKLGAVAVPAKQLKDVVGKLPEGEIKLELDGVRLRLSSGRSRYHLPTAAVDDAPVIPATPADGVEVDAAELGRALDAVAVAMCLDDTRPSMFGIHLHIEGKVIRAVSTDGHRMQVIEVPHKGDEMPAMLVPPKGVALLKVLGKGTARLALEKGSLFATLGDTTVSVKLTDEIFPPYNKVIPQKAKRTIRIERGALLDATKRVLSVNGQSDGVRLTTTSEYVALDTESADGGDGREEVCADSAEGPMVGLNGRYLADALAKCSADEIELWLNDELDPVSVRAEGYIGVVMPMRT